MLPKSLKSFRFLGAVLALAGVGLAPASAPARIVDRVVAVVNDEIVTQSELDEIAASVMRQVDSVPDPVVREQTRQKQLRFALDELIGQKLVSQEAGKHKLAVTVTRWTITSPG